MSHRRILLLTAAYVAAIAGAPLLVVRGDWYTLLNPTPSPEIAKLQVWLATIAVQAAWWLSVICWVTIRLRQYCGGLPRWKDVLRLGAQMSILALPGVGFEWAYSLSGYPPPLIAGVPFVRVAGGAGTLVAAFWA